jgi:DNA repair exonuclease SbcCD ATPase subunit
MSNPKRNHDRLVVIRFEGISEAIYHGDADLVHELYARQVTRADEAEATLVERDAEITRLNERIIVGADTIQEFREKIAQKEATIARLEAQLNKRHKCAPPGTIAPCFPLNSNLAKVQRAKSKVMPHD